jgi:Uncharacterized protein conserved in bacteria (DUF2188)
MAEMISEHMFKKEDGWVVRREGSRKVYKLFETRKDARECARVMALNDCGFVVTHTDDGQFRDFRDGNEIYIRMYKIGPITAGATEIARPIVERFT